MGSQKAYEYVGRLSAAQKGVGCVGNERAVAARDHVVMTRTGRSRETQYWGLRGRRGRDAPVICDSTLPMIPAVAAKARMEEVAMNISTRLLRK